MKNHVCNKCGEIFYEYAKLRTHVANAHPTVHSCSVCGHTLKKKWELKKHMDKQHGEKSVRCSFPDCNMPVAYNRLKRHILTYHTNEEASTSNAEITSSENLDFKCPDCSKAYKEKRQLKKHISSAHMKPYIRKKTYSCTFEGCDKVFKAPCLLDDHINMHNGDFKYECNLCDKRFFSRAQYGVHIKKYHLISLRDLTSTMKAVGQIFDWNDREEKVCDDKKTEKILQESSNEREDLLIVKEEKIEEEKMEEFVIIKV